MKKSNYKSVEFNMVLNAIKTLIAIVFPLITFRYVAGALQVENLGAVTFVQSMIGYVALIATLGISSYAVREGGKYRNDEQKLKSFSSQIFSINIFSTILSYIVLAILILVVPDLRNYWFLLLIQSGTILFTTLGIDWLNIIYEDYLFITIRSIVIQIISFVLIIFLVKQPADVWIYLTIQVSTTGLIAVLNFIYLGRKYFIPHLTLDVNLKNHFKPIMVLFSNSLAVSVYLNIDNVMLKWICNEYYVGIYALSVKVYSVCKQLIASIYSATITRLTTYFSENRIDEFKELLNSVINNILIVSLPIITGLITISYEVVLLLGGVEYLEAINSLIILMVSVLFAVLGGAFAYCVNLPMGKENKNLIATIISAVLNFSLNFLFIYLWKANGAAITTLLSELTVLIVLVSTNIEGLKMIDFKKTGLNILKCLISCIPIVAVSLIVHTYVNTPWGVHLAIIIPSSIIMYFSLNFVLKNTYVKSFLRNMFKKKNA